MLYSHRNIQITVKCGLVRTKGSWLIYLATQDSTNKPEPQDSYMLTARTHEWSMLTMTGDLGMGIRMKSCDLQTSLL